MRSIFLRLIVLYLIIGINEAAKTKTKPKPKPNGLLPQSFERAIQFTSIRCRSSNEKAMEMVNCFLNSTTEHCFTIDIHVKADIQIAKARHTLFIQEQDRPGRKFNSFDIDLCNLMDTTQRSLLKLYRKELQKSWRNFPDHCPIKNGTVLGFNNICFVKGFVPSFAPKLNLFSILDIMDVGLGNKFTIELNSTANKI